MTQPHRRRRDDEHDGHEQRADGVERDDRGRGDARQQQPVGEHGPQPERARAAGLEAGRRASAARSARVEHDRDRRDRAR